MDGFGDLQTKVSEKMEAGFEGHQTKGAAKMEDGVEGRHARELKAKKANLKG